jgi:hypothetical protein
MHSVIESREYIVNPLHLVGIALRKHLKRTPTPKTVAISFEPLHGSLSAV